MSAPLQGSAQVPAPSPPQPARDAARDSGGEHVPYDSPALRAVRDAMYPIVAGLLLILGWQLAVTYGPWPPYLFPGPVDVARAIARLVASGDLGPSLAITMRRLFVGFLLSLGIGAVIGFTMARFAPVRKGLKPYLLGLQSLPSLAWVPVALLWFGFGDRALIFVTVIGSLFAAALMFTDAMASIPPRQLLAARNMGARGLTLVATVAVPAALPAILSGIKQVWSFAWRSLVGAEIVFASVGLGFLLNQGRDFLDVSQVFAVMVITLVVGLLFEVLVFAAVERYVRRLYGLGT